jgi:TonB family protein
MKNISITVFTCFLALAFNAQELYFELRPDHQTPVKKKELERAGLLKEITPGYPQNWMDEYVSVEILVTSKGRMNKALSKNDVLTGDQKNLLKTADLWSTVSIDVKYKTRNAATGKTDLRNMNYVVTVVPDVEASFKGGDAKLNEYIKQSGIKKVAGTFPPTEVIPASTFSLNDQGDAFTYVRHSTVIKFTVNEKGQTEDVRVITSCGDPAIDEVLYNAIVNMPKWTPAQSAGMNVKQDFLFSVGDQGGC